MPGNLAVSGLTSEELALAAILYFVELGSIYDSNGYGAGINAQRDIARFSQLNLWLQICARQSFSDIPADNQQSQLAFQSAAQFCANQVLTPDPDLDFSQDDGVFPLIRDFR